MSGWFTAASGGTIYNGDAFPKEFAGSVFTGDVSGNLIHRDIITPDGATFAAHRAMEKVEFLASTDVWFRPCNFTNAPDGNLYVTDIYRQVIETPESIPEEIRKKIDFFKGDTLGRIYRIVPNHPLRQGDLKPNLGAASSAELVKHLANPNGWHRQTAHRLLLERQDHAVIPDLKTMAAAGPTPEARVHALWLLRAYSALQASDVERATKDSDAAHTRARPATQRGFSPAIAATLRQPRHAGRRPGCPRPLSGRAHPRRVEGRPRPRDARRGGASRFARPVVPNRNPEFRGRRRRSVLSHGAGEGRILDRSATSDRGIRHDRRQAESSRDRPLVRRLAQSRSTGKLPGRAHARPAPGACAEPAGSRCGPDLCPSAFLRQRSRAARRLGVVAAFRAHCADPPGGSGQPVARSAAGQARPRGSGAARRPLRYRCAGDRKDSALAPSAGSRGVRRRYTGRFR